MIKDASGSPLIAKRILHAPQKWKGVMKKLITHH